MFVDLTLFNNLNRLTRRRFYPLGYRHVTIIGLCHLLYAAFNWVFDYVLYVYVVYIWGMVIGGGVMTLISLFQCALTLLLYEKMQIDWVGVGALQEWQTQQPTTLSGRLFRHIHRKKSAVFIFLCVFTDPFIITAYFRQGRFDGLTAKDWGLFFFSGVISNAYWICVSALLGNGVMNLWQWLILNANFGNGWLFEHTLVMLDHTHTFWEKWVIHTH